MLHFVPLIIGKTALEVLPNLPAVFFPLHPHFDITIEAKLYRKQHKCKEIGWTTEGEYMVTQFEGEV
jgi:hypothetical protein